MILLGLWATKQSIMDKDNFVNTAYNFYLAEKNVSLEFHPKTFSQLIT